MHLRVGSLFSGIGALDIAIHNILPSSTIWFVECEKFCQKILRKRFPDTQIYDDVCSVGKENLAPIDILVGGFPCQDISVAGNGKGITKDTRSGLFFEMWRIATELQPRIVLFENVPLINNRGLDIVTESVVQDGWTIEWFCLSASDVGAWHRRERWWGLAHREKAPLFQNYTMVGHLQDGWRTMQKDLFGSSSSVERMPRAGMARDGKLYSRKQSKSAEGFFNTPNTMDHLPRREGGALERSLYRGEGNSKRERSGNLREDSRLMEATPDRLLWPTPTTTDHKDSGTEKDTRYQLNRRGKTARLGTIVSSVNNRLLWPTPTTMLGQRSYEGAHRYIRNKVLSGELSREEGASMLNRDPFAEQGALKMYPTPIHGDGDKLPSDSLSRKIESGSKFSSNHEKSTGEVVEWLPGKLNPDWVEPLMGLPSGFTDLESDTSPDMIDASDWVDGTWEKGIPRLTERKDNRVSRIKALGNSVVPQCAFEAFRIIRSMQWTRQ